MVEIIVEIVVFVIEIVVSLFKDSNPKCTWDAMTSEQKDTVTTTFLNEAFTQVELKKKVDSGAMEPKNYPAVPIQYFWTMFQVSGYVGATGYDDWSNANKDWFPGWVQRWEAKYGLKFDGSDMKKKDDGEGYTRNEKLTGAGVSNKASFTIIGVVMFAVLVITKLFKK